MMPRPLRSRVICCSRDCGGLGTQAGFCALSQHAGSIAFDVHPSLVFLLLQQTYAVKTADHSL